jgi:hypothetical protein
MGLTNTNGFRGSAAFFALLLAGASGAAAEPPGADTASPDHSAASFRQPEHAAPASLTSATATHPAASKFRRRLLPPIRPAHARSMLA